MAGCIFCSIAAGELSATFVHEDDHVVAIEDLHPVAPTHVLVMPRAHHPSVREVDAGLVEHMIAVANSIAGGRGLADRGYRLVFNVGSEGGQTVPHLHLHLIGGRQMAWPPG